MFVPTVIKYVSIDGLTRYEAWNKPTRPEDYLNRIGSRPLRAAFETKDLLVPHYIRRTYFLSDSYIDETNGNRIFEYREEV